MNNHSIMRILFIIFIGLFQPIQGTAAENTEDILKNLQVEINERFDGLEITALTVSPVPGVYELVSGGQVFYISEDANHLFTGALIDTVTQADLTAARKSKIYLDIINEIDDKDMLVYEPENEAKGTVTVFTDTSCPYCSRLHAEIDELLDEGIRVRYLMFPRAGIGSKTHQELESVWCAEDPHEAMTDAKAGMLIDPATCDNPIEMHVEVANAIGLRGTPLIYLDDGQAIAGYRPAKDIINLIKE